MTQIDLFYTWIIGVCIYTGAVYSHCTVDTSSRTDYKPAAYFMNHAVKSRKMNDTLNNCKFGKSHNIFEGNICMDHCSLRSNCVAVQTSGAGCRFCVLADYDPSRVEKMEEPSFRATYVNASALESMLFSFICYVF